MAIRWDEIEGADFGPYLYSIKDGAERHEVLFRQCYDEIRSFCWGVLARIGNVSDADDAVQEALMKAAWAKTYKPEMPFRPWLRQIACNVCIDFARAQLRTDKVNERILSSGFGVGLHTPASEMDWPEEAAIRNELIAAVVGSLLKLPEPERDALCLRLYKGLSYDEISALRGHSHSSVRSAIYRAKEKLKGELVSIGGIDDWGVPGVVGVAVAALRRFRARSRAWVLRNSPRGSNLAVESAPLNVALMARATEVVAAGVLALGAFALPHGGGIAAAPPNAAAPAPISAVHAPSPVADQAQSSSPTSTADTAGSNVVDTPTRARATELRVAGPGDSGPAQTATVERKRDSIVIGEELVGPLPVVGEDYSRNGETEYGCGGTSGEAVCGTYDRLPLGS